MIYDLSILQRSQYPEYDIVIVGAGASGIVAIKRILEYNPNLKICILESGSLEANPKIDQLDLFESQQSAFNLSGSRARYLGGKSNLWDGRLINLEPEELDKWPIKRTVLDEYINQALEVLGVPKKNIKNILDKANKVMANDAFGRLMSHQLMPSVAFFAPLTKVFGLHDLDEWQLRTSKNIDLYLHANVENISLNDDVSSVCKVNVYDTLRKFEKLQIFKAKKVLLAAGGIEVVKILSKSKGISDLLGASLGKNFSGHPRGIRGLIKLRKPISVDSALISKTQPVGFPLLEIGLRLKPEKIEGDVAISRVVLNAVRTETHNAFFYRLRPKAAYMRKYLNAHGAKEYGYLMGFLLFLIAKTCKLLKISQKTNLLYLRNYVGSSLNSQSQVIVSEQGDVLVDWKINDTDKKGLVALHEQIKKSLSEECNAEVKELISLEDWTLWGGSSHFMSTTVMHEDQKLGVVDPNCKVHGVDNLWITGPSVFPTPSHANPMLMIVALSMYVGDKIAQEM